ncbi:hypothetical protein QQ045_033160 [Rhodiola kirilowii]
MEKQEVVRTAFLLNSLRFFDIVVEEKPISDLERFQIQSYVGEGYVVGSAVKNLTPGDWVIPSPPSSDSPQDDGNNGQPIHILRFE